MRGKCADAEVFGGWDGEVDGYLDELWAYMPDADSWQQLAPGVTPPVARLLMILMSVHGRCQGHASVGKLGKQPLSRHDGWASLCGRGRR